MTPILIESAYQLPDRDYYIYGTGLVGQHLATRLQSSGRTGRFKGFLTSFDVAPDAAGPLFNIHQHLDQLTPSDIIVIVNQYAREIGHILAALNPPCQVFDGILLVFRSYTRCYGAWDKNSVRERMRGVSAQLGSSRSRELYEFLVTFRLETTASNLVPAYGRFYALMDRLYGPGNSCFDLQYFEYGDFSGTAVAVEGGGNMGLISRAILSRMKPDGRLYSFEPLSETIQRATAANRVHADLKQAADAGRYQLVSKALWSAPAELGFATGRGGLTEGHVVTDGSGSAQVPATSIDCFRKEAGIDRIDFIKLDVEGAEPQVIEGARETIEADRPRMAISIYHSDLQLLSLPETMMALADIYSFEIGHHSNSPWLETVLYCLPKR